MLKTLLYPLDRLYHAIVPDFTAKGKMRRQAEHWLELAGRVYDYRRDQLSEPQTLRLQAATGELRSRIEEKAGSDILKTGIEKLELVLRDTGGKIYPVTSLVENVDFFLVAAIVILGMRAYFVQPFKIPTNSMWPTYYGMTHELDKPGQETNLARKAWRLATLLAWHYQVNAPQDGELLLPVFSGGQPAFTQKPGRSFLVMPTVNREYRFAVGGEEVALTVPGAGTGTEDFRYERVLHEAGLIPVRQPPVRQSEMEVLFGGQRSRERVYWVPTGRMVKKGEPILSFDILTGDMLFVDRISYNFFKPKVGDGFVFHTREIKDIAADQYYVKRLVGTPGDELEVREPTLYRNGQPIAGSEAFVWNARKEGKYRGYTNGDPSRLSPVLDLPQYLQRGAKLTIPAGSYFAMGDNSMESSDSRVWGFVPDKEVVGRPLFIYYPFTRRWGLAK